MESVLKQYWPSFLGSFSAMLGLISPLLEQINLAVAAAAGCGGLVMLALSIFYQRKKNRLADQDRVIKDLEIEKREIEIRQLKERINKEVQK